MKKVVVTGLFMQREDKLGETREEACFGNNLHYPGKLAAQLLQRLGFSCHAEAEVPLAEADLVICADLSLALWERMQQLPIGVKKVLQVIESPIYAPLSHDAAQVLRHPLWDLILTWNRGFSADYIVHYDLAMAGQSVSTPVPAKPADFLDRQRRGVVVASYKRDYRGFLHDRNRLYTYLADRGEIELYGRRWGHDPRRHRMGLTPDKLLTISSYAYSLVVENNLVNGYVTEKIADSILAGTPVIYWGDWDTAARRFPGTFVPLRQVELASFVEAREALFSNYGEHVRQVEAARAASGQWCDSYLAALERAVRTLFPG